MKLARGEGIVILQLSNLERRIGGLVVFPGILLIAFEIK
jgi:hypothetical protein